jgi:hypothetical protein
MAQTRVKNDVFGTQKQFVLMLFPIGLKSHEAGPPGAFLHSLLVPIALFYFFFFFFIVSVFCL